MSLLQGSLLQESKDSSESMSRTIGTFYRKELQVLTVALNKSIDLKKVLSEENLSHGRGSPRTLGKSKTSTAEVAISTDGTQRFQILDPSDRLMSPTGASIEQILERMVDIDSGAEPIIAETFLHTFRYFMSPKDLLVGLFNRCILDNGGTKSLEKWSCVIRLRAAAFLFKWMQSFSFDFLLDETQSAAHSFLESLETGIWRVGSDGEISDDKFVRSDFKKTAEGLKRLLHLCVEAARNDMQEKQLASVDKKKRLELADVPSESTIANEMTRQDFVAYSSLTPIQFMLQVWGSKDDPAIISQMRPLTLLIQRFNSVSYWTATEICTQPELRGRVAVLERVILIAKVCGILQRKFILRNVFALTTTTLFWRSYLV